MLCLLKPCLAVYLETHFNFPCNLFAHSFPAECILGCITALPSFEKKYEAFGVEEAPVLLRCWASPMVCATQELVLGTAVPSWIIHRGELWWWMIGCKQCMTLCMTLRESKHISFYFHFFFFFFPRGGAGPHVFPWQDNFSDGGILKSWPPFSGDFTGLVKTFPNNRWRRNSSDDRTGRTLNAGWKIETFGHTFNFCCTHRFWKIHEKINGWLFSGWLGNAKSHAIVSALWLAAFYS